MEWKANYPGGETAQTKHLYLRRDTHINFIRISGRKAHVGAFIGRLNYGTNVQYRARGIEFFFYVRRVLDFGFAIFLPFARPCVRWSGSTASPYSTCVVGAGPFAVFFRTPAWLKKWKQDADQARWETEYNNWEE